MFLLQFFPARPEEARYVGVSLEVLHLLQFGHRQVEGGGALCGGFCRTPIPLFVSRGGKWSRESDDDGVSLCG